MQTISINFIVPGSWEEMSDKQLRYVYQLLADNFGTDEIKTLFLLKWSGTKVIGRQDSSPSEATPSVTGSYLVKLGKQMFELTPLTLAELLVNLDWLGATPTSPVRPSKMNRRQALAADFQGVPFETFIVCDNYFQGYLQTQQDYLLYEIGRVVYQDAKMKFLPWQRIAIFYWMVALKDLFARQFPEFFQPAGSASDGNLLGKTPSSVEASMNAQIRALTKGDVTKEAEVLALDTWRALTELNAQAREYKVLNAKMQSK